MQDGIPSSTRSVHPKARRQPGCLQVPPPSAGGGCAILRAYTRRACTRARGYGRQLTISSNLCYRSDSSRPGLRAAACAGLLPLGTSTSHAPPPTPTRPSPRSWRTSCARGSSYFEMVCFPCAARSPRFRLCAIGSGTFSGISVVSYANRCSFLRTAFACILVHCAAFT